VEIGGTGEVGARGFPLAVLGGGFKFRMVLKASIKLPQIYLAFAMAFSKSNFLLRTVEIV